MRCFISLDLPNEMVKEIIGIQEKIKKNCLFTGKFTEKENLHLTLKFLGEIDNEKLEKVKEKLKEIKFSWFNVNLSEIGVFSKKNPKIIWIKLSGKGVTQLQKKIDEELKDLFLIEERFMSHITIARIKNVGDKKGLLNYLLSIKTFDKKFEIKEFFLKKSELLSNGPIYSDIEAYSCINKINMFD